MTTNLSSSLMGLSILTGSNAFSSVGALPTFESKAVKLAKAQFTMAPTTPPWKEDTPVQPLSSQVATVTAMKSIIDKSTSGLLSDDVQTAFTTYKALDRLRSLAEAASADTSSNAQRAQLQKAFAKGLADLQSYLGQAPTSQMNIAFGKPLRSASTNGVPQGDQYETMGQGLVKNRTDAIPGLTGGEQFKITLNKPGISDVVTVDLSQGAQPPTIDSVTAQINAAIQAIPLKDSNGTPLLDKDGNQIPRWQTHFVAAKTGDKWGFKLDSSTGVEHVSIDQVGAGDSLVVATGATALDAPTATTVFRIDDPSGDATRKAMTTISALDGDATELNVMQGKTTKTTTTTVDMDGKVQTKTDTTSNVYANTDAAGIVTDAQGNTYVVGTTKGELGSNESNGNDGLFLTKMDGAGNVVWQRALGAAGTSSGAAVSLAPDGSIVVAGTVSGSFDTANSDGDMIVAKYSAMGDEKFTTIVRSVGSDTAKAVAVGADGSIFVGGKAATGTGDGFVARIDTSGKIAERKTFDMGGSESVTGLAIAGDGNVLALVSNNGVAELHKLQANSLATELGTVSLGKADARAIAVNGDGTIAIGGAADAAISGTQTNSYNGGRDGFVARIDANLSGSNVTYLGTGADDQVDSVAFVGGKLYAGGRTTGDLGATRRGPTDGFVAEVDNGTGAIGKISQFGQSLLRTEPVRIAGDPGGDNAIGALGFGRGTINPEMSAKLTTAFGLRAGDSFKLQADNGAIRTVTITADDTIQTLNDRLASMLGTSRYKVSTSLNDQGRSLRIEPKAGHSIELISGPSGSDALAKLGIEPQRISVPATVSDSAPKVRPGGDFGLNLSESLNLTNLDNAKYALGTIKDAISMSQTAYRSLYWDDLKAKLVDGGSKSATTSGTVSPYLSSQLSNYQAALNRLNSSTSTLTGF
ncbi:hypothetical protein [Sphingomonas sp.]|uniref:hypothetical protein n=1 Tax=Sphingomonas sp. TaxID=28214 RepID=UPI001B0E5719|nr:hypothetical protein [Sphingomonas sp.]MBO9713492.1 hypothetical protein [Sphingomonas sp.]